MDYRATLYSNAVFLWKGVLFLARSYFLDFQRLVQVRSASMTNTKPAGGVVSLLP